MDSSDIFNMRPLKKGGLLLPCNVVVQEAPEGGVTVSIADPRAMFSLVNNPRLNPIVEEADLRLRRVIASLD